MTAIQDQAVQAMPRYRCHKEVYALKVKSILWEGGNADHKARTMLTFEDPAYAPIELPFSWKTKHDAVDGGYYVVYADGYQSFSPANAFEEGYTKL